MAETLQAVATDRSTFVVELQFRDSNGSAVAPTSAVWSLRDSKGNIVNARDQVAISSPAATSYVITQGDDNAAAVDRYRILTVEAQYDSTLGSGLPLNAEFRYRIIDLEGIE